MIARSMWAAALLLAYPWMASAQPGRGEASAARFGWLSSLAEGKAQARKTGKPLMVTIRCVP
jgi:hypothetical protein